ncbi:hypothetical protein M9X92_010977 [Pyricularia oryzae]|nr:hypothetical protein M9X92_010977 [Pyricularia oryzae]
MYDHNFPAYEQHVFESGVQTPLAPQYSEGPFHYNITGQPATRSSHPCYRGSTSSPAAVHYIATYGQYATDEWFEYNGCSWLDSPYVYVEVAPKAGHPPSPMHSMPRRSSRRRASMSASYTTAFDGSPKKNKSSSKNHSSSSRLQTPLSPSNESHSKTDYHNNYAPVPSRYQSVPTGPEPRRSSHSRRSSVSTPLRPQTTASGSSYGHKISSSKYNEPYSRPQAPPPPPEYKNRKATQKDAKRFQIPECYSLSHWDPEETPFILAGSVFDANSLGKWIYDWVAYVYRRPEGNEMQKIAGELWLLLIQISGKIKQASEIKPNICILENREMLEGFIELGERLNDKLRRLLKRCEGPMLGAERGKKRLGKRAGIRFIHTFLGRDYELDNTEKFMASARLWNLRFDANCEDIILTQTKK